MAQRKRNKGKSTSYRTMVEEALNTKGNLLRVYGGTVITSPYSTGWGSVKGTAMASMFINEARANMGSRPRTWSGVAFVFHTDDTFSLSSFVMEDAIAGDIDVTATKHLDELWFTCDAKLRLSTGWLMVPSGDFDIDDHLGEVLKVFTNAGSWDASKVSEYVEGRSVDNRRVAINMDGQEVVWYIAPAPQGAEGVDEIVDTISRFMSYSFEEGHEMGITIESDSYIRTVPPACEDVLALGEDVSSSIFTTSSSSDANVMLNILRLAESCNAVEI